MSPIQKWQAVAARSDARQKYPNLCRLVAELNRHQEVLIFSLIMGLGFLFIGISILIWGNRGSEAFKIAGGTTFATIGLTIIILGIIQSRRIYNDNAPLREKIEEGGEKCLANYMELDHQAGQDNCSAALRMGEAPNFTQQIEV